MGRKINGNTGMKRGATLFAPMAAAALSGCILDLKVGELLLPRCIEDDCPDLPEHDLDALADLEHPGDFPMDPADEPGEAGEEGSACLERERLCADGLDQDCDGLTDCEDPECDGMACDDGNDCTGYDLCSGGACAGTLVVCLSDGCATRTCTGTSSCSVSFSPSGSPCNADSNPCMPGLCNGAGNCIASAVGDGASCGSEYRQRCCGGRCVDLFADNGNCGGCGISCGSRSCVILPSTSWAGCTCTVNVECRTSGTAWTCYNGYCNCQEDADCAPGQDCEEPAGHNYCHY